MCADEHIHAVQCDCVHCDDCKGFGKVDGERCYTCDGTGYVEICAYCQYLEELYGEL